jgi:epoxyqueuosine reductase
MHDASHFNAQALTDKQLRELANFIDSQALALGFSQIGVSDLDLSEAQPRLLAWLAEGYQGDMHYLQRHAALKAKPDLLVPGVIRSISVRLDYLPIKLKAQANQEERLGAANTFISHEKSKLLKPGEAVVSVYARGRDYHKLMRHKLQLLAESISARIGPFGFRVFTDSAPVMEVELARKAGLGWRGKNTLLLNQSAGSFFFLGEILVDVPLPLSYFTSASCGICQECMDICPTKAIIAPYVLDARRCISYLTIEHQGAIPKELRRLMGNRIYGCDDCQTFCPWNKYAQSSTEPDFAPRNGLESATLLTLWAWSEEDFLTKLQGSAIRRIGYSRWLRNLAVALGNALNATSDKTIAQALEMRIDYPDEMVREHVMWALEQGPMTHK